MNKSEEFWDKASKNYDKTEERFEYIHSKSRKTLKSTSRIAILFWIMDVGQAQYPVNLPIR